MSSSWRRIALFLRVAVVVVAVALLTARGATAPADAPVTATSGASSAPAPGGAPEASAAAAPAPGPAPAPPRAAPPAVPPAPAASPQPAAQAAPRAPAGPQAQAAAPSAAPAGVAAPAPAAASPNSPAPATTTMRTVTSPAGVYAVHVNTNETVVRWNPCQPVRWRANLAAAPPGALLDAQAAFAALSAATGITFVFDGQTDAVPTRAWLRDGPDRGLILLGWFPRTTTDLYGADADGEGGWYERGTSRDGKTWSWQIVRGFVALDPASTARYAPGFGPGASRGALLLHEVAHAAGLAHSDDKRQLMYPLIGATTAGRYSGGDLAGLTAVGRSAGCL